MFAPLRGAGDYYLKQGKLRQASLSSNFMNQSIILLMERFTERLHCSLQPLYTFLASETVPYVPVQRNGFPVSSDNVYHIMPLSLRPRA